MTNSPIALSKKTRLKPSHRPDLVDRSNDRGSQTLRPQLPPHQSLKLLNSLRFGVLVVTVQMQLVHRNQTAEQIFADLQIHAPKGIPQALINYCQQFIREASADAAATDAVATDAAATDAAVANPLADPLIIDCQPCKGRLLRWQISWFPETLPEAQGQPCLLVVVEDCYRDLVAQMRRDQKRYGLTDREARVWVMLKFGMAYQEIADALQIKLNTVKTHARNVYNKQRDHRPQVPRLWFLDDELICPVRPYDPASPPDYL